MMRLVRLLVRRFVCHWQIDLDSRIRHDLHKLDIRISSILHSSRVFAFVHTA